MKKIFLLLAFLLTFSTSFGQYSSKYTVIAPKAYFYMVPDELSQRQNNYLVRGEKVEPIKGQDGFVYVVYRNRKGKETKGWLILVDLVSDSTVNSYKVAARNQHKAVKF